MKVFIRSCYGLTNGDTAYYRKNGDLFDFCFKRDYASELNEEEVKEILTHADWYKKQYNASIMGVEV